MNKYLSLTLFFIAFCSFSFGQLRINENLLEENAKENWIISKNNSEKQNFQFEIPETLKGKKEILEKRDLTSKHFQNEDGSLTAILAAGPLHYKKNGKFEDINHSIVPSNNAQYSFENTTNLLHSYFGTNSFEGVKNRTHENATEIQEFLNVKMFWQASGQNLLVKNATNVALSVNGDKAYYNNVLGNIDAEFIIQSGKRKLNYIIPNAQALSTIPANADYLVFSEDIILPQGWSYAIDAQKGVLIKDANGEAIYAYENPVSTDANPSLDENKNTEMEAILSGNTLTILTKVKTTWLLDTNRQFPIKVDPTVNVYPNNATNWTRSVYDDGYNQAGLYFGYYDYYWLRGFAKFNSSSIPTSGTIVSAVTGYINVISAYTAWNGPWQFGNGADPTTTSGSTLYNSATLGYSTISSFNSFGLKSSTFFNPSGNTFIQNEIALGRINLSIIPAGTFINNQYYQLSDHTSTNRPYLSITYTLAGSPPSCATLIEPANASPSAVAPPSWNAVAGATSYDVYFGTASNPPLVSTSQTGTTYTPSACLLPGTTYYWKVVPKNSDGSATGCTTWSFTTATKLLVYRNNWETASEGFFGTSGTSVDGWYTNNNSTNGYGETNTWTLSSGINAINGKSVGVSALYNNSYAGAPFQYYQDLGFIYRWIYRPINLTGLRDVEVSFNWKCGGETDYDYGEVISSINSGANWLADVQGGLYSNGKYSGSANTVRAESIVLPATRNNQNNFVLGFKWTNDDNYSNDPSFVVDDIVVSACPYEGVIASNKTAAGVFEWAPTGNTTATLTVNGSHTCAQYQWEQSTDGGANWVPTVGGSGATTKTFTTPSNITVNTWYRNRVYYGTACPGAYQDEVFKITIISGPPSCTTPISPTNLATNIAINQNLEWASASTATSYDVYFGTASNPPIVATSYTATTYTLPTLNAGTTYYWKIVPKNTSGSATACATWSFSTVSVAPWLLSIGGTEQLTFDNSFIATNQPVFRVTHPSTLSQVQLQINKDVTFTQPNVFDKTYTGSFSGENNFVADVSAQVINSSLFPQPFDTDVLVHGTNPSNNNIWFAPSSNTALTWEATGGNPGGRIGFKGSWNYYWSNYIRLPEVNCTGMNEVTLTFDVWHSYFAAHPNDRARIYIWADGVYKRPITALTIDGQDALANFGANGFGFSFTELRDAAAVEVTFDLSGVTDKSNILFYIEPSCGYNNNNPFYFNLDNISVNASGGGFEDNETYYARVKGEIGGSLTDWSLDTFSFTYAAASDLKWYQTAKPQFGTDDLTDLALYESVDRVSLLNGTSIPGIVTNSSFENSTAWTAYKTGGSELVTTISDGANWKSDGSRAGRMYMFGGYAMSSDIAVFSQVMDLTNVEQIIFDAQSHYGPNMFSSLANGGTLRLIIGGTSSNATGTVIATINHCVSGSSSCSQETLDKIGAVPPANRAANQLVKFVWTGFTTGDLGGALVHFMFDNVRSGTASTNTGKLISTPINIASFQDGETWSQLLWEQTLNNGTLKFSVEKYNGTTWTPISGLTNISESTNGAHTYDISAAGTEGIIRLVADFTRNGPPDLFNWGLTTKAATPLPVSWLNVSSTCLEKNIQIHWSTATEINNDYFEVYASTNGVDFESIGRIKGAGNSSNINKYSFKLEKRNKYKYFRVKQNDFDGQFEFSKIVTANCFNFTSDLDIYPNPFDGSSFYINYNNEENDLSVKIYDLSGKLLEIPTTNKTGNKIQVNLKEQLAKGTYLVEIYNKQGFLSMKKLITK